MTVISSAHKTTSKETVILILKANLGAGCLALPYSCSLLGAENCVIPVLFLSSITIYNMNLVVECKKKIIHYAGINSTANTMTYGDIAEHAFGPRGKSLIDFFLLFLQLSICTVFVSFVSNNILSLFPAHQTLGYLRLTMALLLIPLLTIVTNLRTMQKLSPLAAIAFGMMMVGLLMIFVVCIMQTMYEYVPPGYHVHRTKTDNMTIWLFISTVMYAFEGIGCILPIEAAMLYPEQYTICLIIGMGCVTLIYISIAEFCLMAYHYIDDGSIIKFLQIYYTDAAREIDVVMMIVNSLVTLSILFSYPLQLYPATEVMDQYLSDHYRKQVTETHKSLDLSDDSSIDVSVASDAGEDGDASDDIEMRVYASSSANGKIVEETTTYNVLGSHSANCPKEGDTSDDIVSIDLKRNETGMRSRLPVENDEILHQSVFGITMSSWIRITSTVGTTLIAICIPYVSLLIPLAGASCGATLALILPPLMDICLWRHYTRNTKTKIGMGGGVGADGSVKYQSIDRMDLDGDTNHHETNTADNKEINRDNKDTYPASLSMVTWLGHIVSMVLGVLCAVLGTINAVNNILNQP